jgi:uncharacterized sporulation protein YeaH/YhbH (DUF444 family)
VSIRQDHGRFRDIVKGRVKENFKKYITHGEMIGKRENDLVKIPIPSIDLPRFIYGPRQSGGVGQGKGEPGDAVGEEGDQPGQGQAGSEAGEHMIEAELTVDELAEILGEELQRYISSGTYNPDEPIIVPIKRDMRYRQFRPVVKPQANAVVIYMMDVSGSMGEEQKEIVRLESFWINAWLKKHYKGLQTRFLIHDAAAKEVDEKTFFSTSESGGTLISSVLQLATKIINEEYPPNEWNIYPFHFSDGDNWSSEDTRLCMKILKDEIIPKVNMFCYGQVESRYGSGQFLKDLEKEFPDEERILLSKIENRDKIIDSIKHFLGKGN